LILYRGWLAGAGLLALVWIVAAEASSRGMITGKEYVAFTLAAICVAIAVIAWHIDPAWSMSAALVLTVFNGNWQQFGLPPVVAPDRFVLMAVIATIVLRGPGARGRPPIPWGSAHAWLLGAAAIAIASAAVAGTLVSHAGAFPLFDRFGLLPFVSFALAPVIYRTQRQRAILVATLVALGAYLGLTAIFEIVGPRGLVFPRYILSSEIQTHFGRARGPFVEAATNGFALYACALVAVMAAVYWRRTWARVAAAGVALLCVEGLLLTLQRSVWIGVGLAALTTALAFPRLRRRLPLTAAIVAVPIACSLLFVPGLTAKVLTRASDQGTIHDRENLNAAALNMLEQRPLFGFGWATFELASRDYYVLSQTRPLVSGFKPQPVHNIYLSNLAELGLVGTTVWLVAVMVAFVGPLRRRGPPASNPWKILLGSTLVLWAAIALASPIFDVFPHRLLWTLGGVAMGMTLPERRPQLDREAPC
jgi:putative inorganic carbon (HCO3(-)) transporter